MTWKAPEVDLPIHLTEVVNRALGYDTPLEEEDHLLGILGEKVDGCLYELEQAQKDPSKLVNDTQPVDLDSLEERARVATVEYEKAVEIYNALSQEAEIFLKSRSGRLYVTNEPAEPQHAYVTKASAYVFLRDVFDIEIAAWRPRQEGLEGEVDSSNLDRQEIGVIRDHEIDSRLPAHWDDVTLQLRAANKLKVLTNSYQKTYNLEGTALVASRNKELTVSGALLAELAKRGAIPNPKPTQDAPQNLRTALSKLRVALKQITGIDQDPFMEFSKADGWRPRFKMEDCRTAADERARDKAVHVSHDDNRDSSVGYDPTDDYASDY